MREGQVLRVGGEDGGAALTCLGTDIDYGDISSGRLVVVKCKPLSVDTDAVDDDKRHVKRLYHDVFFMPQHVLSCDGQSDESSRDVFHDGERLLLSSAYSGG